MSVNLSEEEIAVETAYKQKEIKFCYNSSIINKIVETAYKEVKK